MSSEADCVMQYMLIISVRYDIVFGPDTGEYIK